MYARLSRFAGLEPERIDEMVRDFREGDYLEGLERASGFQGFVVGVDWNAGKAMAVSFWDTREDMQASDQVADRARADRIEKAQPARDPIVDRYEVVVQREGASLSQRS